MSARGTIVIEGLTLAGTQFGTPSTTQLNYYVGPGIELRPEVGDVKRRRLRISRVISYVVLITIGVVGIAPFAYLLVLSSKSGLTLLDVPPSLHFDWTTIKANYGQVIHENHYLTYVKNSILVTDASTFLARAVHSLTMFRIGERMCCVAVGLAGLRQQYEWSRICRLQAEGEVEEDERVDVERCKPQDIDENPHANNDGLGDEKARRAKKTSKRFGLQGKPVVAKN